MARSALLQFPIERLQLVSSPAALTLQGLFGTGAPMDSDSEGLIARYRDLLAVAG